MKKYLLLPIISAAFCTFAAFGQEQPEAPRFNGADVQYFMRRLIGEFGKVVRERNVPAETLSPKVGVAFMVRADGSIDEWRFRDSTSEGRDRCDLAPASRPPAQRWTEAFSRLGRLDPPPPMRTDARRITPCG